MFPSLHSYIFTCSMFLYILTFLYWSVVWMFYLFFQYYMLISRCLHLHCSICTSLYFYIPTVLYVYVFTYSDFIFFRLLYLTLLYMLCATYFCFVCILRCLHYVCVTLYSLSFDNWDFCIVVFLYCRVACLYLYMFTVE